MWRIGTDLAWAGDFVFSDGFLSHWQIWIGAAVAMQYAAWRLNRYAGQALAPEPRAGHLRVAGEGAGHRECIARCVASTHTCYSSFRVGGPPMRYDTRYRSRSSLFNWSFPTGVKWLIITNVAVYLVYFFGSWMRGERYFWLTGTDAVGR